MVGGLAALGAGGAGFEQSFDTGWDNATKQLGEMAFGRTLQLLGQGAQQPQMGGGMPPQGPPMGLPSMPPQGGAPGMNGPMAPGMPPPGPQGGPPMQPPMGGGQPMPPGGPPMGGAPGGGMPPPGGPPGMPPGGGGMPPGGGPPGMGGGQPVLDWRMVMQKVSQANPGLPPNALAAAVDRFMPLMGQQSQQQWREMSLYLRQQQLDIQEQGMRQRGDIARMQESGRDTRSERAEEGKEKRSERSEEGKDRRFNIKEERLENQNKIKNDQAWQRLEMQKQRLEQQMQQSKDRSQIAQWRAIVDAQHKRATEIIQSSNMFSKLTDEERAALRKDADQMRDQAIERMRAGMGSSTPTGGTTTKPEPKVEEKVPTGTPTPGRQPIPEAFKKDPDGTTYEKDGKTWTKQGDELVPAGAAQGNL